MSSDLTFNTPGMQSWRPRTVAILLGVIALATSVPFVFDGFATGDSMQYAAGVESLLKEGFAALGQAFNGDMSIGYYAVVVALAKILGGSVALSTLMNVLSALASVILQLLLFVLFMRIRENTRVAFFTCLAVMLAPTVWFHSHYGHPVLLALSAFTGTLIVLDRLVQESPETDRRGMRWVLFTFLATVTALLRLDIILCFPAFFGLLWFRKAFRLPMVLKTFGALVAAGFIVVVVHWVVLGTLSTPAGGALMYHVTKKLGWQYLAGDAAKNFFLFVFAVNLFMLALSLLGWISIGLRSRLSLFLLSWILPWAIFLPFKGMDYARICLPTVPPLMFLATVFVDGLFRKNKWIPLVAMLLLAQITSALLYSPVSRYYTFRHRIDGRVIASVPLGFPPVDQYYRQRMIRARDAIIDKVALERSADVLIISDSGTAVYEYWLYHNRTVVAQDRLACDGVVYRRYQTPENVFYAMDTEFNAGVAQPTAKIISCLYHDGMKVHVAPFAADIGVRSDSLYLSQAQVETFLHEAEGTAK